MTDRPLSILHVLAPADVGGLETVVRTLALGHSAMGHSVTIAAVLDVTSNPFVEEARDAGLKVHVIHSPARTFAPERSGVRRLLTELSVDVMHSHGYRSDILDIGVARAMGIPSVTTLHGFSATDRKARVYEWLQIRTARRASAIVAVSANVAEKLFRAGAARDSVHLIPNALGTAAATLDATSARQRLGIGPGLQIGWVGRLSSEKGPDVMLQAMTQLADLQVGLSLVGDGTDRLALTQLAGELDVARNTRFHGRVPHAAELLRAFDVLALSSRTEGTPMVLLEAMACGVPIVATRVGGVPDMLSADEAILVAPDDPPALAAGLRSALADPNASAKRAERARARLLTQFDTDSWLREYESLYRSIQPLTPAAVR
ncbi:MAG: glycosyltransferase [Gemmatimonadaceae bacterium]